MAITNCRMVTLDSLPTIGSNTSPGVGDGSAPQPLPAEGSFHDVKKAGRRRVRRGLPGHAP